MEWKIPQYSRNAIINAGKIIKDDTQSIEQYRNALTIIDNWRASHAYPLQVFYVYIKNKFQDRDDIIVAQRLKRLSSIVSKLERLPNMNLWEMQDLGGCRIIVPTINDVYATIELFTNSRRDHKLKKVYDYIETPKKSGYRSLHMVYEYKTRTPSKQIYNRHMLLEIQIRTKLQHLWATAVETMELMTNQALKASLGDEDVLAFFIGVSKLFSYYETGTFRQDNHENIFDVIQYIIDEDNKHNYLSFFRGFSIVRNFDGLKNYKDGYYLLSLDYKKGELIIQFFKSSQINEATEAYNRIENTNHIGNELNTVLVAVESFNKLRRAYPNYFIDLKEFPDKVLEIMHESIVKNQEFNIL